MSLSVVKSCPIIFGSCQAQCYSAVCCLWGRRLNPEKIKQILKTRLNHHWSKTKPLTKNLSEDCLALQSNKPKFHNLIAFKEISPIFL